jgi:hypothetical protein
MWRETSLETTARIALDASQTTSYQDEEPQALSLHAPTASAVRTVHPKDALLPRPATFTRSFHSNVLVSHMLALSLGLPLPLPGAAADGRRVGRASAN